MAPAKKVKVKEEATPTVLSNTYMFPNGDRYDGEYMKKDDGGQERSGNGIHTTSDGTCYNGQWDTDKMNGHGSVQFPSGASFQGEFVNNQFHGKGKYSWPNGSFYEGQFVENRMEGGGSFTDTEGQMWHGTFRFRAAPGLKFGLNL